ncbi:MAG: hypothetical protein ACLQVY_28220 [Limisphaerales bacterium]
MNLHSRGASGGGSRREDGIALVITLLMLSVITFLAVAFLAMTRRDRAAATASVDVNSARAMSDAAFARAQAEIIARMMAQTDWLSYDYTVSRNYINQNGFVPGLPLNTTNVNYDVYTGEILPMSSTKGGGADWAQNIANLYYDPRPPVFVVTNPSFSTNSDFRFWVDVNRNGRFETNGYIPTVTNEFGNWNYYSFWNGEPEFIGVLNDPFSHHSSSNRFVGRYAYMVLPIGKTLDLNYIHNWLKGFNGNIGFLTNGGGKAGRPESDGFARDQGIGSWELNLATMLDVLSPSSYENPANTNGYLPYNYTSPLSGKPNTGYAFDDAESMLHYRYYPPGRGTWPPYILANIETYFGRSYTNAFLNLDTYCANPALTAPFVYTNVKQSMAANPWPGSYTSNLFYEPQDLFDTNKTSQHFVNCLLWAEARTNFFDRYTFQRLLGSIGTGSSPEYGVFVYTNSTNAYAGSPPTWLRTKVNINYDNTAQITNVNAPFAPMPTNLVSWAPITFFTNAADLLLRSQEFVMATNIYPVFAANGSVANYIPYYGAVHFGITNIPIYNSTNPTVRYSAKIHRMLQLAANIYEAANGTNFDRNMGVGTNVYYPHVYRPQFSVQNYGTNYTVTITNYVEMAQTGTQLTDWYTYLYDALQTGSGQMRVRTLDYNGVKTMYNDHRSGPNDLVLGVPWVIGTVKGVPSFNQFAFVNSFAMTRRLDFLRLATNVPPQYMSQSYEVAVSNYLGAQLFNPYSNAYPKQVFYTLYNTATVSITNTNGPGYWYTNMTVTNNIAFRPQAPAVPAMIFAGNLHGYNGSAKSGIVLISATNAVAMFDSFYSESTKTFRPASIYTPFSLPADLHQGTWAPNNARAWPNHSWVLNVTNYVLYCMWTMDGTGVSGNPRLLDFVNLGPIGTSLAIIPTLMTNGATGAGSALFPVAGKGSGIDSSFLVWNPSNATDNAGFSAGVQAQIAIGSGTMQASDWPGGLVSGQNADYWQNQIANFYAVLNGGGEGLNVQDPFAPTAVLVQSSLWQANDPLVHYTMDDMTYQQQTNTVQYVRPVIPNGITALGVAATNLGFGAVGPRYSPWNVGGNNTTLFKDPGLTRADAYNFPTNKFPSIGWLGRVHRGTPWQTVYFKPDSPTSNADFITWTNWSYTGWPDNTYPTNDWVLPDLFTAVPNDNAARGLLSVNQTNDAAWAAVFGGLIIPTNYNGPAYILAPSNVYNLVDGQAAMGGAGGINYTRAVQPNGLFHHVGDIFRTPALITNFLGSPAPYSDEVAEAIPQQILSLLKVGYPQFVIYSWGQSLRPKSLYFGSGPNFNICTNYEITGEVLTRTVCHVVSDPLAANPKLVIDSFNIEPGN